MKKLNNKRNLNSDFKIDDHNDLQKEKEIIINDKIYTVVDVHRLLQIEDKYKKLILKIYDIFHLGELEDPVMENIINEIQPDRPIPASQIFNFEEVI
ncbi:MAG: hypothetical protein LBB45_03350 [Methanobrevibacter sp.]|jgi:hypothetical protein|nr:hypothetical protein [Candidatus Methanovirga basalitermitum]